MGKKGIRELERLSKDPTFNVKRVAVNGLVKVYVGLGEKGIRELERLSKDPDELVKVAAANGLRKIRGRSLLLGKRVPFMASANLPDVLARMKQLNGIAQSLRGEFGKKFVGIVVFGSMAKGYATAYSDVDYAILATDDVIGKRFRELARKQNVPLCKEHYVNPFRANETNVAPLFYGWFFGNKKALNEVQREAIKNMNEEEWENIREEILIHESTLYKAFERYRIGEREKRRVQAAAALRVPPSLGEMKKLLGL